MLQLEYRDKHEINIAFSTKSVKSYFWQVCDKDWNMLPNLLKLFILTFQATLCLCTYSKFSTKVNMDKGICL